MTYDVSERNWELINNGKCISQFQPDIITSIRRLEWISIKICRQKSSILSNHIYIYIYIYMVWVWVIVIFRWLLSFSSIEDTLTDEQQ